MDARKPKSYEPDDWQNLVEQLVMALDSAVSSCNRVALSCSYLHLSGSFTETAPLLRIVATCDDCLQYMTPTAVSFLSNKKAKKTASNLQPQLWLPDRSTLTCMICRKEFTLMTRRHHCRKCGRVVCRDCAPAKNTRPLFEMGMKEPVRHCKDCYRSPSILWDPASPSADFKTS